MPAGAAERSPADAAGGSRACQPDAPNAFCQTGILYRQSEGLVTSQPPRWKWSRRINYLNARGKLTAPSCIRWTLNRSQWAPASAYEGVNGKSGCAQPPNQLAARGYGGAREGGVEDVSRTAHPVRNCVPSQTGCPTGNRSLLAIWKIIDINEKRSAALRPGERHKLNHPAAGPMNRSAVG